MSELWSSSWSLGQSMLASQVHAIFPTQTFLAKSDILSTWHVCHGVSSDAGRVQITDTQGADTTFPSDLPVPQDDGAADHLQGTTIPSMALKSTSGTTVDVSTFAGLTIIFCYPRTGAPGETVPESWNVIPGARGCTPQACSFRDLSRELLGLGVSHIFGCSTQDTAYQQEVKGRTHLPFQLLSDEDLSLLNALKLPSMEWEGRKLIRRLTMAVEDGKIIKVWYPVFPPDANARQVCEWLEKEFGGRENLSTSFESQTLRNLQHR